jgi:hypothetical protein
MSGDFALLGGASTTMGPGAKLARVLGARLRLRAREGATDMVRSPLFFLLGVNPDEALDGDEGTYPDAESWLTEATSAQSGHERKWPA